MYALSLLIALVLSLTVLPWWLLRLMKSAQQQAHVTVQRQREKILHAAPLMDETASAEGNLSYLRRHEVNQPLIDADNDAVAMPDIAKTLSGRR